MSLTQQPRVWFSWNLQEKAFKQTLSISKVESEDTIAIWEKLNFRGSNRPKFHLNPKPEIFSKFVFVLSLHVWQDIDGAKGPRPRCAAWLQLDRASANNGAPFKRKTFLKINISIHPAVVCKKQKEKKIKGWDSESHGPSSDQRSSQMLIWQPALKFQWTQTRCFVCVWDFKDKTSKAQKTCSFWRRSLASMWPRWPLTCRKTLCSLSDRRLQRLQKGEKVSKPPLRAERGCRPTRVL